MQCDRKKPLIKKCILVVIAIAEAVTPGRDLHITFKKTRIVKCVLDVA